LDEINEAIKKFQKELNGGTAALVLLSVLDKAHDPMYGYQIAKMIETRTGDNIDIMKQGALYPVLRSLEATGLLQSEVEPSVSGPPRRYYRITEAGRQTLGKWVEIWDQTRGLVDAVIKGGDDDK
jgi:PadR family transcriptional regulator, regulatory protein PadR